jgi:hypothetical protein
MNVTMQTNFRTRSVSCSQSDLIQRDLNVSRKVDPKKYEANLRLLKFIEDNIVGKGVTFSGPFGRRKGKRFECYITH